MKNDTPEQYGVRALLKQSWIIAFGPGYRTLVGLSFLWLLLWGSAAALCELANRQLAYSGAVLSLFLEPMFIGLPFAIVGQVRGQPLQFEGMFSSLPLYGKLLLWGFLFRLIMVLASALVVAPLVVLGLLFPHPIIMIIIMMTYGTFAIGLAYVAVRLSFGQFAILDTRGSMPIAQTIKASWQLTREPVGGRIFLLGLTLMFISVLATCLLVLPLFFIAVPWSMVAWALAYDQAVARLPHNQVPSEGAPHPHTPPHPDPATAPAAMWTKP